VAVDPAWVFRGRTPAPRTFDGAHAEIWEYVAGPRPVPATLVLLHSWNGITEPEIQARLKDKDSAWVAYVGQEGFQVVEKGSVEDLEAFSSRAAALRRAKYIARDILSARVDQAPPWRAPERELRAWFDWFEAQVPNRVDYVRLLADNDPNGSYDGLLVEPVRYAQEVYEETFEDLFEELPEANPPRRPWQDRAAHGFAEGELAGLGAALLLNPHAMHNPPDYERYYTGHDVVDVAYARDPDLKIPRQARPKLNEPLGSGSWGTVYPTRSSRVVFKITEDADEARFVAESLRHADPPLGVVRYYGIVGVPMGRSASDRLWLLWREAADMRRSSWPGSRRTRGVAHRLLSLAREAGHGLVGHTGTQRELRVAVAADGDPDAVGYAHEQVGNRLRGGSKDYRKTYLKATKGPKSGRLRRFYAQTFRLALEQLRDLGAGYRHVADAMLTYLYDYDAVLIDVHEDNVGVVRRRARCLSEPAQRGGQPMLVITDPGLTVFYASSKLGKKELAHIDKPPRSKR